MLLRLPIDPDAHDDAAFRASWGRENCIVWGRVRQADFGPCTHTLSIRAAGGGVEHCRVDDRTIGVDDSTLVRQMRRWTRHTPGQVRAGALGAPVGRASAGLHLSG